MTHCHVPATCHHIAPHTLIHTRRDYGPRADRQQSRLIWLIEQLGMDKWKQLIEEYMGGGVKLRPAVKVGGRLAACVVPG